MSIFLIHPTPPLNHTKAPLVAVSRYGSEVQSRGGSAAVRGGPRRSAAVRGGATDAVGQKISKNLKNLKFSKIKNIQNHYNRPKFKPTYYETKLSPENIYKKINTQKLAMYYVWTNINAFFRHFENQL